MASAFDTHDENIYRKALAYRSPLPVSVLYVADAAAAAVSSYGSGYFFYWIFTIDAVIRNDFDILNPLWWFGMIIGVLVSLDIYVSNYKHGQNVAHYKLINKTVEVESVTEYWDKLRNIIGPLRIAARYTTVIGFACLLYGKIDYMMQGNIITADILQDKKQRLQQLENSPLPEFEKTQSYADLRAGLFDGLDNDTEVYNNIAAARMEHNQRIETRENDIKALRADIDSLQKNSQKLNNVALFEFLAGAWRVSSAALIIASVMIAGFVVDKVFGMIAAEIGENHTNYAIATAFNPDNLYRQSGVNYRDNNVTTDNGSTISGGSSGAGNSYGIDFSNIKNMAILGAIKNDYMKIKADGKRVSFTDIGNKPNINVKRQYVHKVKDAAIEEGLLPADFMKQFEGL